MVFKKMKWIISVIILFITCGIIYEYRDTFEINEVKIPGLKKVERNKNPDPLRKNKVVITDIHMGIGDNTSVGMELACPYSNSKQHSQLWKYSNQIKSDFLLQVGSYQLKNWVKEKDYDAIKATFRNIVNKYVDDPVTEVYLSKFFIE